ncbi:MAG: (2Fe-2S)-binding protein [Terracidiphilus sp.]
MKNREIPITLNGKRLLVAKGTTLAAAAIMAGEPCRVSVRGEPRAPLCGMGVCMECRMTVDGVAHRRACKVICAPGMVAVTE